MNFTYKAYEEMLFLLKENHYEACNYDNYKRRIFSVILRHDVDFSLEAALRFAELEYKNHVQATYFVLLSTSFYNLFHKKASDIIKKIKAMGHDIGLHFDEANYSIGNTTELINYVQKEKSIMSHGLGMEIKTVSMHRPSKWLLEANVKFDTVINSYGKEFFNDCKYISDSRMHWREDVHQVIKSKDFNHLHILTHPIWYGIEECNMHERLKSFIRNEKDNCYYNIRDNIRDLDEILPKIGDI